MAEGLQRRIEYSDLKFISSFAMEKILDFQTWEDPGEHARGNFRLLLSENETGINGLNAPIQLCGHGNTAGALFCGYQETDWNFLKRMASQLGLPLVPDISYYYPRFYLGLPEGEKKELGEILSCDMCFDGRYYAVSGRCTVDRKDFICYDVVTGT